MPESLAANKTGAGSFPFFCGGVQSTISLQPAILAGMANISTVEKSGAVPPGMYKPTFSMPTLFCQHFTPGVVSITFVSNFCAAWNLVMLAAACSIAAFKLESSSVMPASISASETNNSASSTLSNWAVYLRTATSPLAFTSSRTDFTFSLSEAVSKTGRFKSDGHSVGLEYFITFIF